MKPDTEDLEWLEDKGDYEAFSHVVYDEEGRGERIEEDGVVVPKGLGGPETAAAAAGVAK